MAENSDKTWKNYIRTSELLFSSVDHDRTYYHYASDEMGSITHITQGENVLNEYEYDVWGEVVHSVEKVENRFKFNGQQLDPITGQYYLRARFYNPVIARFTQEDAYRGDGLNLYAYCRNNPVYYVEPTGHLCKCKKEVYDEARRQGYSASEAYQRATGNNPLAEGVNHTQQSALIISRYATNSQIPNNSYGGYQCYDIGQHGNLSPQSNRAIGHSNTVCDNLTQSHHIIQDHWASQISGYDRNIAPAILLQSRSGQEHAMISALQRKLRNSNLGYNTSARSEFDFAYNSMQEAGIDVKTAQKAIREAYKYFDFLGVEMNIKH